jgi:hypothetical protein
MLRPGSQVRLLARHFLWRFLDNDLMSPDSDVHDSGTLFLVFLAVPSLIGTALLLFLYANPFVTPNALLLLALNDKYMYVAWSMLVMALVTLVSWDALSLDARDYAILGPLPIASRTLLAGKLVALLLFVSAVVFAVNVVPVILYPPVCLSSVSASLPLPRLPLLMFGHACACFGAAVFGFLAVVGLRSMLLLALGPRLFRGASLPVQFVTALALVIGLFPFSPPPLARDGLALWASPPAWFLGLYEAIAGPSMMRVTSRLEGWQLAAESQARQTYLGYVPVLQQLAQAAVVALVAAVVVASALYFAAHFRHARHLCQQATATPPARRRRGRAVAALVHRWVVPDPVARASFFFVLKTFMRSARHKLYVGGYVAAGVLLTYASVVPLVVRRPPGLFARPTLPFLSAQFVLSFFLLVGLRAVFAMPAELRANWVFRLTAPSDVRRMLSGVRRAVVVCLVIPFFVALAPLHAAMWGWGVAARHAGYGVLWALVLVEVLLLQLEKMPFTCSQVPGRGKVRLLWPVYLAGFATYSYWFANRELAALSSGSPGLALLVVAVFGGLVACRAHLVRSRTHLVFHDIPDTAAITLDI